MVWIEIIYPLSIIAFNLVTTLVVVWIEIISCLIRFFAMRVTTLVVVWIEIHKAQLPLPKGNGHHSRSGVD